MVRVLAALVCVWLGVAAAHAEDVPEPSPKETLLAFAENFNAANLDGIDDTLSGRGDFLWIEDGTVIFRDKAQALGGFAAQFAVARGARMEFEGDITIVQLQPNRASAAATFSMYVPTPEGPEARLYTATLTATLVREGWLWQLLVWDIQRTY